MKRMGRRIIPAGRRLGRRLILIKVCEGNPPVEGRFDGGLFLYIRQFNFQARILGEKHAL
jgi:hypothetical protein